MLLVFLGEQVISTNEQKEMRKVLFIITLLAATMVKAQQYTGMQGLIHVPTADMDTVGVARIGAQYLPKEMVSDKMTVDKEKFNTFTNYLSITPFRWIEIGYCYTLWKFHKNKDPKEKIGFYAKDRYFSVRIQPIREAKWWPSVVIGGNDVISSGDNGTSGSMYNKNFYVAMTKHAKLPGVTLGGHVAYRKWKRDYNHKWNGVVGGITLQPDFYSPLRAIVEWDGNEVNAGVDCRLFKFLQLQCALQDGKNFTGGLCFCINLL